MSEMDALQLKEGNRAKLNVHIRSRKRRGKKCLSHYRNKFNVESDSDPVIKQILNLKRYIWSK